MRKLHWWVLAGLVAAGLALGPGEPAFAGDDADADADSKACLAVTLGGADGHAGDAGSLGRGRAAERVCR